MADLNGLERLSRLRESGALSEAEYEQEKAKLLAGRGSSATPWVIGIVAAILVVAAGVFAFTRQLNGEVANANLSAPMMPTGTGSGAIPPAEPTPTAPASPTPVTDPDVPAGRGKTSVADPIAQIASQATGMVRDTVLNVAGKRVVLFRPADDDNGSNYVLMVGGQGEVLEDAQTASISAVGNYVVVEIDSGGTACPAEFRIVDVAAGRITKSFGTCSDLIKSRIASDGSIISVVHSFNVGGPVTARYARGTLTTWGEL